MSRDPSKELATIFVGEATDILAGLGRGLLELEACARGEARDKKVREIFRLAHTLKGASASAGRDDLAEVVHALETLLDAVRAGALEPSRPLVDASLAAVDLLQVGLARLLASTECGEVCQRLKEARSASAAAPAPAASSPAPASAPAPSPAAAAAEAAAPQAGEHSAAGARGKRAAEAKKKAPEKALRKQLTTLLSSLAAHSKGGGPGELDRALGLIALVDEAAADVSPLFATVSSALHSALGLHQPNGKLEGKALAGAVQSADFLLSALDGFASEDEARILVDLLQSGLPGATPKPAPAPAAAPKPRADGEPAAPAKGAEPEQKNVLADATVRTPVALLDNVLYRIDELVALKLRLQYQTRQVEDVQVAIESDLMTNEARDDAQARHGLRRRIEVIRQNLAQEVHLLGIVAQALQDDVREIRMVPFGPMLDPLRRMVRDLAHDLGKEAVLEIQGEDVCADKRLLELVRDPLVHVLRNAVDHGLESPAVRREGGKPERGTIQVVVESRESHIWVQVRDDGGGIDPAKLRKVAVAKGLLEAEQAKQLTDREALNLIFTPGFSTASKVTEISGRGVGLDVVRENVARLGGRIEFYSDLGKGTQFTLCLPLALAASRGLLVNAGKETYCIPLPAVEEVVGVEAKDFGMAHGFPVLRRRNQTMSFLGLQELLSKRSWTPQGSCFAVVLALSDRRLAVGVDSILGQEEVVVKGLAAGTPKLPFVAGATNLADGRLVTVLEPGALMATALSASSRSVQSDVQRQATILVADDSLTTRTMMASVLERAGYRTLVAPDGEAAWATLLQEKVDMVVSDFEMPNLDGIGLVQRLRGGTPAVASLPFILVTSRGAPEDRARGAEAGADAYIVKAEFDPPSFLSMVADLLGSEA